MSWPGVKLDRLENLLAQAGLAVAEVTPLIASLLSIPIGDRYAPITLSPERQKERTIEALVAQLVGGSHRDPRLLIVEDAHWSDPSTLEVLDRLVDEFQEAPVLAIITYRPEFESRWRNYAHVTTHMLNRLTRPQVTTLIAEVAGNKGLPREVLNQIVAKTDGVPLFVEELNQDGIGVGPTRGPGRPLHIERAAVTAEDSRYLAGLLEGTAGSSAERQSRSSVCVGHWPPDLL
jgi:predicted ATPase